MSNLLVFALIGLLTGAATRLLYPGRRAVRILGTVALGIVGAVAAGMISWNYWPRVDGQFQSENLFMSLIGALIVLALGAGVECLRHFNGYTNQSI